MEYLHVLFKDLLGTSSGVSNLPSQALGGTSYTYTVKTEHGKGPQDAQAHHVKDADGRLVSFQNPHPSFGIFGQMSFFQGLFMYIRNKYSGRLSAPDTSNANIPAVKASFLPSRADSTTLRATWLGHAAFLLEFPSGFRALCDPIFEERHVFMGPKRFSPAACKATDLVDLDAIFISHSHHDHLSLPSVKALVNRFPKVHFFVGHGLGQWFRDSGISAVTEMDWWDDAEVILQKDSHSTSNDASAPEQIKARVSCLPSQHGSGRTGLDYCRTLWASWAITSGGKSAWFAGDTGYRYVPEGIEELGPGFDKLPRNPQFAQIGQLRGPFDVGLIPIGAYHPAFMYSAVHASPYDAVEIFQDTQCRKALAMHWGTFALTSEPVEEPPLKLKEALESKGLAQYGIFDACAVGESREF